MHEPLALRGGRAAPQGPAWQVATYAVRGAFRLSRCPMAIIPKCKAPGGKFARYKLLRMDRARVAVSRPRSIPCSCVIIHQG